MPKPGTMEIKYRNKTNLKLILSKKKLQRKLEIPFMHVFKSLFSLGIHTYKLKIHKNDNPEKGGRKQGSARGFIYICSILFI